MYDIQVWYRVIFAFRNTSDLDSMGVPSRIGKYAITGYAFREYVCRVRFLRLPIDIYNGYIEVCPNMSQWVLSIPRRIGTTVAPKGSFDYQLQKFSKFHRVQIQLFNSWWKHVLGFQTKNYSNVSQNNILILRNQNVFQLWRPSHFEIEDLKIVYEEQQEDHDKIACATRSMIALHASTSMTAFGMAGTYKIINWSSPVGM